MLSSCILLTLTPTQHSPLTTIFSGTEFQPLPSDRLQVSHSPHVTCFTQCHVLAGGRLHIHATSDGLKKDTETFPDLRVTLKAQGLHAPLIERFVELPMDVTAGTFPHLHFTSASCMPPPCLLCCRVHQSQPEGPVQLCMSCALCYTRLHTA